MDVVGRLCLGTRFLVPLTPFWVLLLAPMVEQMQSRKSTTNKNSQFSIPNFQFLALISTIVQLAAVSVNYVNYEIQLRSLFPTDWADRSSSARPPRASATSPPAR